MKSKNHTILLSVFIAITGKTYGAAHPACPQGPEKGDLQARDADLQELIQQKIAMRNGDLSATLFDAIVNNYPEAIDVVDYLTRLVDINNVRFYRRDLTPLLLAIENNNFKSRPFILQFTLPCAGFLEG